MDGSCYGESSSGNGRSGSSRKGKKSNPDKPKQPQRGLGVAQLEKIRLRNQMNSCYNQPSLHGSPRLEADAAVETAFSSSVSSSSYSTSASSFGFLPNTMMGLGDMESADVRYGDSSLSSAANRWNQYPNSTLQQQQPVEASVTRHFLDLHAEDSALKKRRQDRCDSMGSSSHNSDTSEGQELDLELKLSL